MDGCGRDERRGVSAALIWRVPPAFCRRTFCARCLTVSDSILRRPFLKGISITLCGLPLALSLALSGCSSTPGSTAGGQASIEAPAAKKPRPIVMPSADALRGEGLYYYDDDVRSRFWITSRVSRNGLYPVGEDFRRGTPHGFTWGAGAAAILRSGRSTEPQTPEGVEVKSGEHIVLKFRDFAGRPVRLNLKLEAYDISGLPIGGYLRTRAGRQTPAGFFVDDAARFPEGSVGYRSKLWVDEDEVIVPTKTAFTGSTTIEEFSKRFTKDIPYCLRYMPRKSAEPIGIRFEKPIAKKTERVRGRTVEKGQSGEVELHAVKKGTLFCAKAEPRPKATAEWTVRYVQGTRVLEFDFPSSVRPEDYGVLAVHNRALKVGFAEERLRERGRMVAKLRPARIWKKGVVIEDQQWRFNARAAAAIDEALEASADKLAEWRRAHPRRRR